MQLEINSLQVIVMQQYLRWWCVVALKNESKGKYHFDNDKNEKHFKKTTFSCCLMEKMMDWWRIRKEICAAVSEILSLIYMTTCFVSREGKSFITRLQKQASKYKFRYTKENFRPLWQLLKYQYIALTMTICKFSCAWKKWESSN